MDAKIINEKDKSGFPLALITGGSKRIGKAFAISLAQNGYGIILHYFTSKEEAFATTLELQSYGVPVFPLQADLTKEDEIISLFTRIDSILADLKKDGFKFKVLVNSAAIMEQAEAGSLTISDYDKTLNLNLRAPFLCAQLAYKRMETGGVIINVSDVAAQKAWKGYPAYTISKAGIESMTRVLARSFAPSVRVNSIAPGLIIKSSNTSEGDWNYLVNKLPVQRTGTLDELGKTVEFLIMNEYITGQTIVIDGGYSLI